MSSKGRASTPEAIKSEYLQALKEKAFLQENLPHLYGWKWYPWAKKFFESRNRYNFLVAANQISKSSTNIRKCIHWATHIPIWKELWPTTPRMFWYLYPDFNVATVEFNEKWVKEFLPRGPMKDHPVYGWTDVRGAKRQIESLHFNSGVSVYFKSYEQKPTALQTASVHAVFADEEMPVDIFDEINMRISSPAINGYFHMVFTATIGQEFWWLTMEERGDRERFKDAFKQQISMYDCLKYEDGTPSMWTIDRIKEIEANCKSRNEVLRRVYGRFVVSDDLKYPAFDEKRNFAKAHPLPKDWAVYAGVDPGTGGRAHPAAIAFIAVNPEMTKGRVFRCWRGDGVETTSSDLVEKFCSMKSDISPVIQVYDWAAKDFMLVAGRLGIPFIPANKDNAFGERLLNTLFKTGMLQIYDCDDGPKAVWEFKNARAGADKSKAKDDLIDAIRFAVCAIPWDFAKIAAHMQIAPPEAPPQTPEQKRMDFYEGKNQPGQAIEGLDLFEAEFDEANETMEYFSDGDPI